MESSFGDSSEIPAQVEVAVVGCGPVGQLLTALLARAGHRVVAIERHAKPYPLPRAIHFDHEVMRIMQGLGLAASLAPVLVAADSYCWYGADGEPILTIDGTGPTPSGWRSDYTFFQPDIEERLIEVATAQPTASVIRGWEMQGIGQDDDSALLTLRYGDEPAPGVWEPTDRTATIRADFVVGADGAGSRTRTLLGIEQRDLGFSERWVVVDVRPHATSTLDRLPQVAQYCDPRRPAVCVRNGPLHQRWEFLLMPDEDAGGLIGDHGGVWRLLDPWIAPEEAEIVRAAGYTFHSMAVEHMRRGRVLLAGDAAHQMPPHMGQGMCAGFRDAQNLAWKLSLVLSGLSGPELLDSYELERSAQNEALIGISLQMGRVSCETDPVAAAARDAAMRSGDTPPPPAPPPLWGGEPGDPLAGQLSVQPLVHASGREVLLDDLLGGAFALLVRDADPAGCLEAAQLGFFESIGGTAVTIGQGGLGDADGRLTQWMSEAGVQAVLVRPDFYVLGSARAASGAGELIDRLSLAMHSPTTAA